MGHPRTIMDEAFLTLAQWLSPGFPVGAFAYSHGLEQSIAAGHIRDPDTLSAWLSDLTEHGALKSDLVLLMTAHRDTHPVEQIDDIAKAMSASAERLMETEQQGQAFVQTVNAVWSLDLPPLTYPVAVGAAAGRSGLPMLHTAQLYAQSVLANLIFAAQRVMPLGQTRGQAILAQISPTLPRYVAATADIALDDIASASFAADIDAMRHETLQPRIFRT